MVGGEGNEDDVEREDSALLPTLPLDAVADGDADGG